MNLSTAIMLVNKSVRSVRVEYDPDNKSNNNPNFHFKTLDPDLKVSDLVVVPTSTRHGFTVCKITEIDIRVDFNSIIEYKWIVGKVDKVAYDAILAQEKVVLDRVAEAEENRIRAELAKSMGLGEVSFSDLDIVKSTVAIAAPATPRGAGNTADTPEAPKRVYPQPRYDVSDDVPF